MRELEGAYLVAGGLGAVAAVLELLEREKIEVHANPDLYVRTYAQFGIEEARELRERGSSRAIAGSRRVFVIAAPGMTGEAQNALLKTLEEPSAGAVFIFVVPSPETLLPTLRSRVQTLVVGKELEREELVDAKKFLAAAPQKRLDMLAPLLEKGEDEKRDTGAILAFLSSIEQGLKKNPEGLTAVYRARKYIADKGALVKPLLEQVALLVPRVVQ